MKPSSAAARGPGIRRVFKTRLDRLSPRGLRPIGPKCSKADVGLILRSSRSPVVTSRLAPAAKTAIRMDALPDRAISACRRPQKNAPEGAPA